MKAGPVLHLTELNKELIGIRRIGKMARFGEIMEIFDDKPENLFTNYVIKDVLRVKNGQEGSEKTIILQQFDRLVLGDPVLFTQSHYGNYFLTKNFRTIFESNYFDFIQNRFRKFGC